MKQCGDCTLCCKLLAVPELNKPANKWCEACAPGIGCTIHPSLADSPADLRVFPAACQSFQCVWLTSDMPDALRPDNCGVVLYAHDQVVHAITSPEQRDAWEKNPQLVRALELISKVVDVVFVAGDAKRIIPRRNAGPLHVIKEHS